MTVLLIVWLGAYAVLMAVLIVGMWRLPRTRGLRDAECPPVSIVVTARNEADDLPACLASLAAIDYPAERLQLVLVNDRSTDETPAILTAFAATRPHVAVVHTSERTANGLEAKARGIAAGMRAATGEWVLITDADGTVPRSWARHLLSLATPDTGMLGGALVVRSRGAIGAVERISWGFVQFFSAGAAGLGVPFACVGPNMAIRRDVYERAGGLERARFRVAEDLALFRMVVAAGLRVRMALDAETTVRMSSVADFRALLSQQRRWLSGGLEQNWVYRVGLSAAFGWGWGVAVFLALGWLRWPLVWAAASALRMVLDSVAVRIQARRIGEPAGSAYLALMEFYSVFAFAVIPLTLLLRPRVLWRGAGYVVKYAPMIVLGLLASAGSVWPATPDTQGSGKSPKKPGVQVPAAATLSPRATMTLRGSEVVLEVGSIDLPAAGEHDHHGASAPPKMPELPPLWVAMPVDGWFHGYRVELVDAAGAVLSSRLLHHVNVIATRQRELFSPIMLRVAASGGETPAVELPRLVGFRAVRGDTLLVRTMFHPGDREHRGVRVRVRFPFTPSSAFIGALRIQPFYLDVTEPHGSHVFDLPPGRTIRRWEARPAAAGRILGVSGHVHPYASRLAFEDLTAGRVLWEVRPHTDAKGQVAAIPVSRFLHRFGIKVDPTHTYRLSVTYDNPTGRIIVDGGMGALGGVMLIRNLARWPAIDSTNAFYRADVRAMSTP